MARTFMPVSKQPPVMVPAAHYAEVMALSKAALADIAWDYAQQLAVHQAKEEIWLAPGFKPDDATIAEFRARRDIILTYRKQDK